jgi:predicted nucleotidyltransferase component of viral defense system
LIPKANITAWRKAAPWSSDWQVEQDLVLSRCLVELFNRPAITERAVFRGGTALHKLFFKQPGRYSEDIDLVQREAGPIGTLIEGIRTVLDPWLGTPRWKAGHGRFSLYYRFETTIAPVVQSRVKLEINTREHFTVHGFVTRPIKVENSWFSDKADVGTYTLPELLGTKLRALYQRKKGRDLFDLDLALDHAEFDAGLLLQAFEQYMVLSGTPVTRAQFEANMATKMADASFLSDVRALLRTGVKHDPAEAWARVHKTIVTLLPGAPWKGGSDAGP